MRHLFRIYTVMLALAILAAPLVGQDLESINSISICVDFNFTGTVTQSDGTPAPITPSGLDSAQRAEVLKKIKSKYDAVLGAANVTVTEAPPGGCPAGGHNVVVSGTNDPTAYGDAGKPPGPSIVFAGGFKADSLKGDTLACAVGECAAHEVGHRCGLSHNCDPDDLMCDGSKVSVERRKKDKRGFNSGDSTRIRAYAGITVEPRPGALGVHIGENDAALRWDCTTAEAEITFVSPLPRPIELGFINIDGQFISSRSSEDREPLLFTFLFSGTYDLAVMNEGAIYPAEDHAIIDLLDEGPGEEKIYRRAAIKFDFDNDNTPDVTVHMVLHGNIGSGFYLASESGVVEGTIASGASLEVDYRSGGTTEPTARLSLVKREHVKLALYDALGVELATIADGAIEAGTHTFDIATAGLPSGVYYLRLQREGEAITRTITIVR